MQLLFGDYTDLVLTAYEERDPNQLPLLSHLTTANIKKECLKVYVERIERGGTEEEYPLKLFFDPPPVGKDFGYAIKKCSADKFRPLQSLIRRETRNPAHANVELLAWLIDFSPRPWSRAQVMLKKIDGKYVAISPTITARTPEPQPGTKSGDTEDGKELTTVVPDTGNADIGERNKLTVKAGEDVSKKTRTGWGQKFKTAVAAVLITATTLGGAYVIWPPKENDTPVDSRNSKTVAGDTSAIKVAAPDKKDSENDNPVKMEKQIIRCKAITKKGTQCKRAATKGGYCWQHQK